ncbi:MAG: hypothetical protein ACI310_06050 [Bacilli bacterium]
MRKNTGLIILVIILSILVILLGGYIVYDKILDVDSDVIDNIPNDNEKGDSSINNDSISIDASLITELKETFKKIYNLYTSPNPYCGKTQASDKMEMGYRLSVEYSSYQEMVDSFKEYASEDVITSGKNARENYLEENGKLYCKDFGKDSSYSYSDSLIWIADESETKISTIITVTLIDINNVYASTVYNNVVFEKDSNNNFIITLIER